MSNTLQRDDRDSLVAAFVKGVKWEKKGCLLYVNAFRITVSSCVSLSAQGSNKSYVWYEYNPKRKLIEWLNVSVDKALLDPYNENRLRTVNTINRCLMAVGDGEWRVNIYSTDEDDTEYEPYLTHKGVPKFLLEPEVTYKVGSELELTQNGI